MNSFGVMQTFSSWYGIAIMGTLGLLSVYLLAVILVRFVFFKRVLIRSQDLLEKVHKAIKNEDKKTLIELKNHRPSDPPIRILVGTGIANHELDKGDLQDLFHVTRTRQRERITSGLSIFGTFATISPFIGLLGTVMGIIQSFNSLAQTGASGPNVVASGVAAALWTTAAGLVVAIPSVIAYNVFKNKAKVIMTDMEVVSRELLILFKIEKMPKLID